MIQRINSPNPVKQIIFKGSDSNSNLSEKKANFFTPKKQNMILATTAASIGGIGGATWFNTISKNKVWTDQKFKVLKEYAKKCKARNINTRTAIKAYNAFVKGSGVLAGSAIGLGIGLAIVGIKHLLTKNKPSTPPPVETPQEPPKPQQTPVDNWSAFSLKG